MKRGEGGESEKVPIAHVHECKEGMILEHCTYFFSYFIFLLGKVVFIRGAVDLDLDFAYIYTFSFRQIVLLVLLWWEIQGTGPH